MSDTLTSHLNIKTRESGHQSIDEFARGQIDELLMRGPIEFCGRWDKISRIIFDDSRHEIFFKLLVLPIV